ncbi:hypothetical protein C7960_1924 [Methanohalophilus euhalobius]|uniref:Uncharacterized protein n=1 Tax=Methanohalophilus euhalobius TaxID=51203 RepID=A0A285EY25_9EURY|nr:MULTISPECIES: hypothetical protein [Methanohalophilus]TCL12654.1 hypothetical protein C7960_1924 [Methanohalophilus euhalobius]SNY03945.1 hypothetical protein SAMN06295989_102238 [Methanohalophilus euhalobius]
MMTYRSMKDNTFKTDPDGQITIDYLAAITIFIFAIFFVFNYTSGLFTPFNSESDEVTLIADRVAVTITEKEMGSGDMTTTNLINRENTETFFSLLNNSYETTLSSLGLKGEFSSYDLNITLEHNSSTIYMAGKPLPSVGNIGQTKRTVLFENSENNNVQTATISVRVW